MVSTIVKEQKEFFASGKTLDVSFRKEHLKKLYHSIVEHMDEIHDGLRGDLGKCDSESYMCETGLALNEISYMLKNINRLSKPIRVKTPLSQAISSSFRVSSPYGTVLVVSPWNYPFLLSIVPLIDAVAAGNTVIVKMSSSSPNTNKVIQKILQEAFLREYVAVASGACVNEALWKEKYDYIFFTGSKNIGRFVYQQAAANLTPVTLELGGKSPCIVDKTANIALAAKRIVWGKFLNVGQTCVAPDYILCEESIKDSLLSALIEQIKLQFGNEPLKNSNYGKIVNEKHFNRLIGLMAADKIVYGGQFQRETLKIEPTVLDDVTGDDAVMQEEIFGPLLPIVTYREEREIFEFVASREHPLALYVFSMNKKFVKRVVRELGFGGGCINDVVIHLATPYMPFGGFGESGLGQYHGKFGFETFSHTKSVVDKKTIVDLPMRYQPYRSTKDKLIRFFLR